VLHSVVFSLLGSYCSNCVPLVERCSCTVCCNSGVGEHTSDKRSDDTQDDACIISLTHGEKYLGELTSYHTRVHFNSSTTATVKTSASTDCCYRHCFH
jgi:hypothetical protein